MNVSFQFDQDPRYGWASIDVDGDERPLIVMHDESGSNGFLYVDGKFIRTCICSAWSASECSCSGVTWAENDNEGQADG